jgi:uncharacterized lipoprotein YehR (DUF1307 family)
MNKKLTLPLALLTATLMLAGCGDSEDNNKAGQFPR